MKEGSSSAAETRMPKFLLCNERAGEWRAIIRALGVLAFSSARRRLGLYNI